VAKLKEMNNVTFAICNEEEYIDELRKLSMADANEDIKVAAFHNGLKFRMDPTDDLQYDEFKKFVTDFTAGNSKHHRNPVITDLSSKFRIMFDCFFLY